MGSQVEDLIMAVVKDNLGQFLADLTDMQHMLSVEGVAPVVRGKIIRLFKRIVRETPQWSGAAASLWGIEVSAGSQESGWIVSKEPIYSKGDDPAVGAAFSNSSWINGAGADQVFGGITISNPQPYIGLLEDGWHKLRGVNRPGMMVANAVEAESTVERLSWVRMTYISEKL